MVIKVMSRLWQSRAVWLAVLLGASVSVAFLVVLLGPIASWATPAAGLYGKDKADAVNATRQILLAAVGGLALLTGAAFTVRSYYLSRGGQLTDRYTKAIALLASDRITERLGGVYALEHLMIESERDHETVVEVLAAFIRERTTSPTAGAHDWAAEHRHEGVNDIPRLETDVQAALTVIGRRPPRPERNRVELSGADLCGANLTGLNLDGAGLGGAKLHHAIMLGAHLKCANLSFAQLPHADLTEADLQDAILYRAQLQGARLKGTQLQRAQLTEAQLQQAVLADADLHDANLNQTNLKGADLAHGLWGEPAPSRGLTPHQLAQAVVDETTQLPADLTTRPSQEQTSRRLRP